MIKDAVPIAAETIISSFNKVSLTEMTTTLGFTVSTLFENQILSELLALYLFAYHAF